LVDSAFTDLVTSTSQVAAALAQITQIWRGQRAELELRHRRLKISHQRWPQPNGSRSRYIEASNRNAAESSGMSRVRGRKFGVRGDLDPDRVAIVEQFRPFDRNLFVAACKGYARQPVSRAEVGRQ
jgi:hypothetical protein